MKASRSPSFSIIGSCSVQVSALTRSTALHMSALSACHWPCLVRPRHSWTACGDRQGKHRLSPEQRLFDIIVSICHNVFFLTPHPTLTCPLAVLMASVRKLALDGLPDPRAATKGRNWTRSLSSPGASFGQFTEVLGCSSGRQK